MVDFNYLVAAEDSRGDSQDVGPVDQNGENIVNKYQGNHNFSELDSKRHQGHGFRFTITMMLFTLNFQAVFGKSKVFVSTTILSLASKGYPL
jgi:uncharacterized membrane protein (DUF485 family)